MLLRCNALVRRPVSASADESRRGGTASRRSAFLLLGAATALGGNLGGVSSALLSLDVPSARRLRLDLLWPCEGLIRKQQQGFQLLVPSSWLADLTLERRKADRLFSLDPGALQAQGRAVVEPAVAFGPPGTAGEENLSIITAPAGKQLAELGSVGEVAERFLSSLEARGSATGNQLSCALLSAQETSAGGYLIEFTVESARFRRHNLALLQVAGGILFTVTAQAPAAKWEEDGAILRRCLESFQSDV